MPWANESLAVQQAFAQRSAIVRAIVVERVERPPKVDERVPAVARLHLPHRARGDFVDARDGYVLPISS